MRRTASARTAPSSCAPAGAGRAPRKTSMMRSFWKWRIPAQAFLPKCRRSSSIRSSARKRMERGWGCPSPRASSTSTGARWILILRLDREPPSASNCPFSRTEHRMARILLIDDSPHVRAALRQILEAEGHKVHSAESGEQGIAATLKNEFDVVVTDFNMPPGSNGFEVIKTLHNTNPHLPVILMTIYHATDYVIEATKLGAYDYIIKPFEPKELLIKIEKAVQSRRLMAKPVEIHETGTATELIKRD